jgi:hypothetical protein
VLGGLIMGLFIIVSATMLTGLFLLGLFKLEEGIKNESYL